MDIETSLSEVPRGRPADSRILLSRFAFRIFLLALLARLIASGIFGQIDHPELWEYGAIARHIVAGIGYELSYPSSFGDRQAGRPETIPVPSAYMPPAYPVFLAAMLEEFGDYPLTFLLILIIQSVAGALGALVVYVFSKRIFPENISVIAGFLFALYPPFIYATLDFGPTTFYLLVLGCVLILYLELVRRPSVLTAIGMGTCAAFLALLRAEGAILAAGYTLLLLFRGRIRYAVLVLITTVIGLSPWLLRNTLTFHSFVPITTSFGLNFWRGNNALATGTGRQMEGQGIWGSEAIDRDLSQLPLSSRYEADRDNIFLHDALQYIQDHPAQEVLLILKKIFYFWVLDLTHPKARSLPYIFSWGFLVLFFAIGLYQCRAQRYNITPLLSYYAIMTAIVAAFFVQPRYQILLSFGIIPVSAAGLQYSMQSCKSFFLGVCQKS